jgi:8-oxo-dGTP pyrophosphatase MutT (NUDIX family)
MELISKKQVLKTFPFTVEEVCLKVDGRELPHPYHRLSCPDWVNILPITADNKAVLIRQPRAGSLKYVLETPGGVMEPDEKDPTMAAVRELEEETGFTSMRVLPLGALNPNPAIMTNVCHFFLALGCAPNPNRRHFPDEEESIELAVVDAADLEALVRTGRLDHALSALCVMLAGKYVKIS